MRKKIKSIASVFLSVVVAFSLSVPTVALGGTGSAASSGKSELNYVAFGASETAAFGMHGYFDEHFSNWSGASDEVAAWNAAGGTENFNRESAYDASGSYAELDAWEAWDTEGREAVHQLRTSGYSNLVENSYPDLLQSWLKEKYGVDKVNVSQLAMSSMRTEELAVLLDDSYDGDEYTEWRFSGEDGWFNQEEGGLEGMRDVYQTAVAEADVITYALGANNFGVYLANQAFDPDFATTDLHNVIDSEDADLYYAIRAKIESYILELADGEITQDDFDTIDNLVDTFAYGLLGFCKYFDRTMELIYASNPDVEVTVVSIQNLMADCDADIYGLEIEIGDIMSIPIDIANAYMAIGSPYSSKYNYANVSSNGHVYSLIDELRNYDGPEDLNQNLIDFLNVYDTRFDIKVSVTQALEKAGITEDNVATKAAYNSALTAAYDTALSLLRVIDESAPMNAVELFDGGNASKALSILGDAVTQAATAAAQGASYESVLQEATTAYNALSEGDQAAAIIGIWTNLGNSFFVHPNAQGHAEMAEAIEEAMTDNIKGSDVFTEAVKEDLREFVKELAEYAKEYIHIHDMTYVAAVAPTCKTTGNYGYWQCSDCEKMYWDAAGVFSIDDPSDIIIPTSHGNPIHVKARAASILFSGNIEYYYCPICKKYFKDADMQNEISYSDTIVPSKVTTTVKKIFSSRWR